MALAGVAFVDYGILFLVSNLVGNGFGLGVSTLAGMTRADLDPIVAYYFHTGHGQAFAPLTYVSRVLVHLFAVGGVAVLPPPVCWFGHVFDWRVTS